MRQARTRTFGVRLVLAAGVWWVLTDGAGGWDAWLIGIPAVISAAWLSAASLPAHDWSWRGAVRYAVFFARESWSGGVDVARRAFSLSMPLTPGFVEYEVRATPVLSRVAMIRSKFFR